MKIYFAHPITGLTPTEVVAYYTDMSETFSNMGVDILQPMVGKTSLIGEKCFTSQGYEGHPCSSNHSILQRDLWMVELSDIVFVDFTHTQKISIGCCMELAVGHWLRKHTIIVLPKENIHTHAFVCEAADVVYENLQDAVDYIIQLIRSEQGKTVL